VCVCDQLPAQHAAGRNIAFDDAHAELPLPANREIVEFPDNPRINLGSRMDYFERLIRRSLLIRGSLGITNFNPDHISSIAQNLPKMSL
jgi:hypothetical protein